MNLQERIKTVLEEHALPYLVGHGGGLELLEIADDGVVLVRFTGACADCPSASLDTRAFVEETLRAEIPEVTRVELEESVDPELLDFARRMLRHEIPNA